MSLAASFWFLIKLLKREYLYRFVFFGIQNERLQPNNVNFILYDFIFLTLLKCHCSQVCLFVFLRGFIRVYADACVIVCVLVNLSVCIYIQKIIVNKSSYRLIRVKINTSIFIVKTLFVV